MGVTLHEVNNNPTVLSAYSTASRTPTADALQLVAFLGRRTSDPAVASVTGCSLTWAPVGSIAFSPGGARFDRIFLYRALGASPTAGAVTMDFGESQNSCAWCWLEVDDADDEGGSGGSAAVVQYGTATADAATSLTIPLDPFAKATNYAIGFFGQAEVLEVWTEGDGFTKLGQSSTTPTGNEAHSIGGEWRNAEDTSVDVSPTTSSPDWGGIAVEVKTTIAGGPILSTLTPYLYRSGGRIAAG